MNLSEIEIARFNMIEQQIRPSNVLDSDTLDLLWKVRREDFVPEASRAYAFSDQEIPLTLPPTRGKSMLPPSLEARILQAARVKNTDTVLEVGTGSGFMAALIAAKAQFVYSIEVDAALAAQAKENLERAGVANVSVRLGNAFEGEMTGHYDVILLSGSLPTLPTTLLSHLKAGGRLLAIIGRAPAMSLLCITRVGENEFSTQNILETVVEPLVEPMSAGHFEF